MRRGQPLSNLHQLLMKADPNMEHVLRYRLMQAQETIKAKRQLAGLPMIYVCEKLEIEKEVAA